MSVSSLRNVITTKADVFLKKTQWSRNSYKNDLFRLNNVQNTSLEVFGTFLQSVTIAGLAGFTLPLNVDIQL